MELETWEKIAYTVLILLVMLGVACFIYELITPCIESKTVCRKATGGFGHGWMSVDCNRNTWDKEIQICIDRSWK